MDSPVSVLVKIYQCSVSLYSFIEDHMKRKSRDSSVGIVMRYGWIDGVGFLAW